MHKVQISVRHLVEFILRSGSIDAGFFMSFSPERAVLGMRVHQRIQKLRKNEAQELGGTYTRELRLRTEYEYKGISFILEGRADGLFEVSETVTIEEIKSTTQPLPQLVSDTNQLHWAQAKCYAYIYALDNHLSEISIALIYGHVETEEWTTLTEKFTFKDLKAFVHNLIEAYWEFAQMEADRKAAMKKTGAALSFPFGSYRIGQREMAVSVYAAIMHKKKLFAQAPTGIGKTIASLYPSVKALAEGLGEKIFYLTSKIVQRHLAEDSLKYMADKGLEIRSITITARDTICFQETRSCNPVSCNYANGHFDRVNEAILDCIKNETNITKVIVEEYAQKHKVCPGEYALDLSLFCDIIICDYNHVYDPKAKLKRFFQDGNPETKSFILLHDESHNLIDRGREMFSAGLHQKTFIELRRKLGRRHPLYNFTSQIAKAIPPDEKGVLMRALEKFAPACEQWLKEHSHTGQSSDVEDILSVYFSVLDFMRVSELYDERYTTYKEPGYIRLFCIDPSYLLSLEQKKVRASIFFSATLTPMHYFEALLTKPTDKNEENYLLRLTSPFPRENLCVAVEGRVSTKYKHREQSLGSVAESLYNLVKAKNGNYIAFFPSYVYLDMVFENFKYDDVEIIRQRQHEDTHVFLDHFSENGGKDRSLLGFAVLGGSFSEGIDLKGERLIGVAVVGVGLPQISDERNLIADHFAKSCGTREGFENAYVYPGMNKVLQAAGRVIRTEMDKGVVLLIDSRYFESTYQKLFPAEWKGYDRLTPLNELSDVLHRFWNDSINDSS